MRPYQAATAAVLIVSGLWLIAVPLGLVSAGVAVLVLSWLLEEVPDAED